MGALARQSFSRWSNTQVDGFIATSAAIRDRLASDGVPRYKTTVIPDGVDVDRIARLPAANVHAEFFLPTNAPIVANVASLVPDKGHRYLVDAAALVMRKVPDARFVIFGDGELRHSIEEQIHHRHLERHVFLAGFRENAVELLKGCDLVVVSAVHEGT
jgi:glycosyltransferase involved in cell wall biosynthesis